MPPGRRLLVPPRPHPLILFFLPSSSLSLLPTPSSSPPSSSLLTLPRLGPTPSHAHGRPPPGRRLLLPPRPHPLRRAL
jgi:hypothetical protein